jgi:glycosyltransferase involved in cell wall biosynthesis
MSITSIIIVSDEGSIARATIESALAAAAYAGLQGLEVRTIVVADRPTSETVAALEPYEPLLKIIEVDAGDLGVTRNHAVSVADGDFVAFLDGDDLWTKRWLWAAYRVAVGDGNERVIVHPQYNVIFGGGEDHIYEHISTRDPLFDARYLIFSNYWLSLSFSRKTNYLSHPYSRNRVSAGFGYEDWKWNCDTIRAGYEHIVAPGTYHLIRRRHRSLRQRSNLANCLMTPSPRFFDVIKSRVPSDDRDIIVQSQEATKMEGRSVSAASISKSVAETRRHIFQSFWWGGSITPYEALCMRSFVDHGHSYHLYTYAPDLNVPDGVVVRDAAEVLPREDYFEYTGPGRDSPSAFSNLFRYKLLAAQGGWWVDTDVICLSGQISPCNLFFALESDDIVNGAVLYFGQAHPVMIRCFGEVLEIRGRAQWGDLGPRLITKVLRDCGLISQARPKDSCYAVGWRDALDLLDPSQADSIIERTKFSPFIHLWNEIYRRGGIDKTLRPVPGSFLRQIADRHPVEGWRGDTEAARPENIELTK